MCLYHVLIELNLFGMNKLLFLHLFYSNHFLQNTKKYDPKFLELLDLYPVNFVNTYISQGENNNANDIVLSPTPKGCEQLYGELSKNLKSNTRNSMGGD